MPPGNATLTAPKPIVVGRYRAAGDFLARPPHLIGSDGLRDSMSKELRMSNGQVIDADAPPCPECGSDRTDHRRRLGPNYYVCANGHTWRDT